MARHRSVLPGVFAWRENPTEDRRLCVNSNPSPASAPPAVYFTIRVSTQACRSCGQYRGNFPVVRGSPWPSRKARMPVKPASMDWFANAVPTSPPAPICPTSGKNGKICANDANPLFHKPPENDGCMRSRYPVR